MYLASVNTGPVAGPAGERTVLPLFPPLLPPAPLPATFRPSFWGSFPLRLSLWYAGTFTLSAALLFALLYVLVGSFFERSEREVISARLKECSLV